MSTEPEAEVEPDLLLRVAGLRTWFFTADGIVKAVDGVDLSVGRGEVVGLVGESGSGKTVTSMSVLGLVDQPGRIVDGTIHFDGHDLRTATNEELRAVRGGRIGTIFQQPISSLNPSYRVGFQVAEVYEVHDDRAPASDVRPVHGESDSSLARTQGAGRATPFNARGRRERRIWPPWRARHVAGRGTRDERWERAVEMLGKVGISDAAVRSRAYPHQISGGQAQRVMIAMALAADPELLIADEPTTALDVTIQAQILDLMRDLQADLGMAVLLITHDLGVVAEMCDRVAVMYAGQIVEETDTRTLFREPKHPYTIGLIGSIPVIGQRRDRLDVIGGRVPHLVDLPPGCRFAPRCTARVEHGLTQCTEALPALVEVAPGHRARCFLHSDAVEEPVTVPVEVTGRRRRWTRTR